jgi:hypothetical protein
MSDIKWGRVVLGVVWALVIAIVGLLVVQTIAITARGFQLRGTPPMEEQIAILLSTPVRLVGVILTALGALVGGRSAARRAEAGWQLNGLAVGIIAAVLRVGYSVMTMGGFTFWPVLHLIVAIVGGWFGGWLAARSAQSEMYD